MHYSPRLDQFKELARRHSVVPVYRQLMGDTLTPVSAFCRIQDGEWAFLFESVIGGERVGRYSFLGAAPFLHFQAWGKRVQIELWFDRDAVRLVWPVDHLSAWYFASTVVVMPPRAVNAPVTVIHRGRHAPTRSSRI